MYTPKTKMSPKKGQTFPFRNTSEPTIDFQETFVRFPGSKPKDQPLDI